jgi:hypothetical protein
MRLVFKREEVADALNMTPAKFDEIRTELESLGFPKPIRGLQEHWAIMHVINWVNSGHDEKRYVA